MNDINILIPTITFGSLLIAALYHTNLYIFNRTELLKRYSMHLWLSIILLFVDIFIFDGSIQNIKQTLTTNNTILFPFIIRSIATWLSFYYYLTIIIVVSDYNIGKNKTVLFLVKYFLFNLPFYLLWFFPSLFLKKENYYIFHLLATTTNFIAIVIAIYLLVIFYKHYLELRKNSENKYIDQIFLGCLVLLVFNLFTVVSVFLNDVIFGLNYLSFMSLGYFFELFFFSIGISLKMKTDTLREQLAIKKVKDQEIQLQNEVKKVADILNIQEIRLEFEKNKAINNQKNMIGRKLHDDLTGSLIALKYLINDYKNTSNTTDEILKLKNIESEIEVIYGETRDFSRHLTKKTEIEHTFDIKLYLQKLKSQFNELDLHKIFYTIDEPGLDKLTKLQTNCLYYCLKECFTNALKHANAQNIWITIYFETDKCYFEFKDDGVGRQIQKQGIGTDNIKINVQQINGNLAIISNNTGTQININFVS